MQNLTEITAVVVELAPRLMGGQVQKVREPDGTTLVWSVRTPGKTTHLVLSVTPGAVRMAESPTTTSTRPAPSALGGWLRANLKGRGLRGVRQLPGDRIVVFEFDAGRLVAALTGRSANLIALDETGRIVATARQSAAAAPGQQWVPPAPPGIELGELRFENALAVEAAAQAWLAKSAESTAETATAKLLRQAKKRLTRLQKNVADDLARCANADQDRHLGELLKSHQHAFVRGDASVEVTDWYAEGLPKITVPLDPKLDPQGNVQRYFDRYRKAQAGQVRATQRQAEVESLAATYAALAADPPDLEVLQARLKKLQLVRPAQVRGRREVAAPRRPFRTWTNARGAAIWVGRGGADNHALTFRFGRGNDVWLHVRDCPGAHVIVPVRGTAMHPETLLDAAALAAQHSDLRDESAVQVTWTQRKHVRAVKGAGPGRVTIAGGKTVTVERPAERVGRLERQG